jgi:hypothetical protein
MSCCTGELGRMNRETWQKLSVVLNVVLIGAVILLLARRTAGPAHSVPIAPEHPAAVSNDSEPFASQPNLRPVSQVTNKIAATSDWKQWIEPLRAIGVPNRVLARLVQADFDERWQKRADELQQKYNRGDVDADALSALEDEHEREQEKELRSALGEDGFKEWDRENTLGSLNLRSVKLSAAETNSIYALQKDLQRRFQELEQLRRKGDVDEADFAELQSKAQSSFDERLKTLLGDDRYAATQGTDDNSGELRRSLKNLNPTDAQFQAMLDVQRQWTERRGDLDRRLQENRSMDAAYGEQIQALDQARDQEYQRVLGTNAFDAFQREQDARYLTMKRYANAWEMDEQNIDYVYRTIKYYEKNVEEYRRAAQELERKGQPVDWEAVNNNLRQFSDQTEQVIQNYLGPDRFNKIKRNQIFPFEQ